MTSIDLYLHSLMASPEWRHLMQLYSWLRLVYLWALCSLGSIYFCLYTLNILRSVTDIMHDTLTLNELMSRSMSIIYKRNSFWEITTLEKLRKWNWFTAAIHLFGKTFLCFLKKFLSCMMIYYITVNISKNLGKACNFSVIFRCNIIEKNCIVGKYVFAKYNKKWFKFLNEQRKYELR